MKQTTYAAAHMGGNCLLRHPACSFTALWTRLTPRRLLLPSLIVWYSISSFGIDLLDIDFCFTARISSRRGGERTMKGTMAFDRTYYWPIARTPP